MVNSYIISSSSKVIENNDSLSKIRTRLFYISVFMKKNYDLTMTESLFFNDSHNTLTPVFLVQIFGCIYFDLMTDNVIILMTLCDKSIPEDWILECHQESSFCVIVVIVKSQFFSLLFSISCCWILACHQESSFLMTFELLLYI